MMVEAYISSLSKKYSESASQKKILDQMDLTYPSFKELCLVSFPNYAENFIKIF